MSVVKAFRQTVVLPSRLDEKSIHKLASDTLCYGKPIYKELIFSFENINFVTPCGVVFLGGLTDFLNRNDCNVFYTGHKQAGNKALKYLDDSGYFADYLGKQIYPESCCRRSTMPLTSIAYTDYYAWLENKVMPWLDSILGFEAKLHFPELTMCLGEVFTNIKDHSGTDIGHVFMQHYPNWKQVRMAISDFGVGIPMRIRGKYPVASDYEAIIKALEDGVTTGTPANRGAGLDNLMRNVVEHNHGEITFFAGLGVVKCYYESDKVEINARSVPYPYPGTLLDIRINTDSIQNRGSAMEEDFLWN